MSIPDQTAEQTIQIRLKQRVFYRRLILIVSGLTLLCIAITSLCIGPANLSLGIVWKTIAAGILGKSGLVSVGTYAIIWDIRFPRVVMALISGAALSICGLSMQGVLRNPLVSPYTLGISSGAAFGASVVIVLGNVMAGSLGEYFLIITAAFCMSLIAVGFVVFLARLRGMGAESLILSGIAVMYLFSAGTSIMQYVATKDQLAQIVFWLMGSLVSISWREVGIGALLLSAGFPALFSLSWHINILGSGEDAAKSLGTNPRLITLFVIVISTLVTAGVVSFTGIIGFIGLVGPHIARLLLGNDHKLLFPASALIGAFLLTISDTIARSLLGNTEIPIGIVTSIIGVPFFISILVRKRRRRVA